MLLLMLDICVRFIFLLLDVCLLMMELSMGRKISVMNREVINMKISVIGK